MGRKHAHHGRYVHLCWDGDGEPSAHYVYGHVTDDEFRAACAAWRVSIPADAKIEQVYVRVVRSSSDDLDYELRHCKRGRGASPRTYFEVAPHRGVL